MTTTNTSRSIPSWYLTVAVNVVCDLGNISHGREEMLQKKETNRLRTRYTVGGYQLLTIIIRVRAAEVASLSLFCHTGVK
jgi:hypothetical protein